MAREEQIKHAANIYATHDIDTKETDFYGNYIKKQDFVVNEYAAFRAGAKWGDENPKQGMVDLSQLWHDASEKPKIGEQLIGEDMNGLFGLYSWDRLASDWSMVVKIFELRRWAYIEDLLPEGGEL